jgi:hypothetical protein
VTENVPRIASSDLLPGDVLIFQWREADAIATKITDETGSPYTHAGIYLGDDLVAEATFPGGVKRNSLNTSLQDSLYVAVLRTQHGFGSDRRTALLNFVSEVVDKSRPFHVRALKAFSQESRDFFDNQLQIIARNYGQSVTAEQLALRSYFCSGFIVACYEAVGIIDSSAQVAYPPEALSPAHLYEDPTFGWLLGYLIPHGILPADDDPLLMATTRWSDIDEVAWWAKASI